LADFARTKAPDLWLKSTSEKPDRVLAPASPICAFTRLKELDLHGDKLARMKPTGQLSGMLENVSDEKSFLRFVEALMEFEV
jgi:hypothetical protein